MASPGAAFSVTSLNPSLFWVQSGSIPLTHPTVGIQLGLPAQPSFPPERGKILAVPEGTDA